MRPVHFYLGASAWVLFLGCGSDGSGKAAPPTQSDTVEVPFQITTVYALEQEGDTDPIARARYYDVTQAADVWGNAGTIALSAGDAAYADGKRLDIETRTELAGTLRVDYSQTVSKGKPSYVFELRRPTETISASVRAPEPFTMTVDEEAPGVMSITWAPVQKAAKVSVLVASKNGCTLVDGAIMHDVDDPGRCTWAAESFRSPTKDCEFDITVVRRLRDKAPARWRKGSVDVQTIDAFVENVRSETASLTLPRRN